VTGEINHLVVTLENGGGWNGQKTRKIAKDNQ
jgi:hypothetical protein